MADCIIVLTLLTNRTRRETVRKYFNSLLQSKRGKRWYHRLYQTDCNKLNN